MDEKLKELLAINNRTEEFEKDPEKKANIRRKAINKEQKDAQLYGAYDENELSYIAENNRSIPISVTDDCKKNIIWFSKTDYVEGVLGGKWSSAESCAEVLFSDKQTIVRCIDNNVKYTFQEPFDLIKYIEHNE